MRICCIALCRRVVSCTELEQHVMYMANEKTSSLSVVNIILREMYRIFESYSGRSNLNFSMLRTALYVPYRLSA